MKRGRLSASDLSIVGSGTTGSRRPMTPLQPLKSDERRIFDFTFREHAHLRARDIPLVTGFARATAGLFRIETAAEFAVLARMQLSYARALRLSVQSRVHPLSLGRRVADADEQSGPRPWDRNRDDNDDEDKGK